ncbi:hypothetical protein [Luteibacter sp. dw_328]|uniref:hypothetical protein n=1 Tax=Luteibacter sp. dw_328 TaxID=2719796 RepID=UPI001BD601AF|nr:hypothetical protein [Luteibacter sp. dw_328]
MKASARNNALTVLLLSGLTCAGNAHAIVPVIDVVNATSNIIQNFQLKAIKHSLTNTGDGTINNYTNNIDRSTTNIDKSIVENTEISNEFTWIISKGSEDEVVPIPREVAEKLKAVLGEHTNDGYAAQFQSAKYYVDQESREEFTEVGFEGSRARKAANDALIKSIEMDQEALEKEAESLTLFADKSKDAKGRGRQQQVANVLAGTQVTQLMKLRSMMLVSEAARAAEAQASADKDARAIATGKAMRAGLSDQRYQMVAKQPVF